MSSRVTRSATRLRSTVAGTPVAPSEPATLPRRKKSTATGRSGSPTPITRPAPVSRKPSGPPPELPDLPLFVEAPYDPVLIPATLTFSFEEAKSHLIKADARFEKIFNELKCRPFEQLEPVDPFQTLVTSILGQQISWLAAKSIRHRFLRLFDRSLPEKVSLTHEQGIKYTFPSPGRVASVNEPILRTAGLSGRKAEYVLDIANRFADGRLSTEKLANASDEELVEMLTAVRGIGKWTVDMFAMFTLRRPDILPVGDLGTQKGLLNWVISSHEPNKYSVCVNPRKLPKTNEDEPKKSEKAKAADPGEDTSVLPTPGEASTSTVKASASSSKQPDNIPLVATSPVQLPEGMTLDILKARANGKKAKGGCYLLPNEMEALTASWKPYRSLGELCCSEQNTAHLNVSMASRVIRSATHTRSLAVVAAKPAWLRYPRKATVVNDPKPPKLPKSPTPKKPKKEVYFPDLAELPPFDEPPYNPTLIPAKLTFSLEQAKSHLIKADARFEQLVASVKCRLFEQLEPIDPFRALVASAIRHNTTWSAAMPIRHRFLRLFDRSLPEEVPLTHEQEISYPFPSPSQVASVNNEILRTTGMNESQAEYGGNEFSLLSSAILTAGGVVLGIAKQFEDGQLSAEKLTNASDKQVEEMLTGAIGKERASMFAITILRRPDILPVGSPKTQSGLLNWVLSSHDPESYPLHISPGRLSKPNKDIENPEIKVAEPVEDTPAPGPTSTVKASKSRSNRLNGVLVVPTSPVRLPKGVTLDTLKDRASGEQTGHYLLPDEMEALTASWKPYRSLGVFYMWALVGSAK
ncbi:unnamed protein product [Rhizoctonia solani]|uniref:HhH-GPD domain-containing protein n=1 Tax=Rhizoctonia solani TaxID=456999 RepID=A0A8H3B5Q0_9AGAM|nr:unnamed protein product [Rhizoctonia solani]